MLSLQVECWQGGKDVLLSKKVTEVQVFIFCLSFALTSAVFFYFIFLRIQVHLPGSLSALYFVRQNLSWNLVFTN